MSRSGMEIAAAKGLETAGDAVAVVVAALSSRPCCEVADAGTARRRSPEGESTSLMASRASALALGPGPPGRPSVLAVSPASAAALLNGGGPAVSTLEAAPLPLRSDATRGPGCRCSCGCIRAAITAAALGCAFAAAPDAARNGAVASPLPRRLCDAPPASAVPCASAPAPAAALAAASAEAVLAFWKSGGAVTAPLSCAATTTLVRLLPS